MANYLLIAGTSDIAGLTARLLLAQGHQIIITGRSETKTKNIADQLGVEYLVVDAADFDQVDEAFKKFKSQFGEIDGVVNFSGSILLKPAHLTTRAEYDAIILANLTTAFATVKAAGAHMSISGGSVVLISSAVAMLGVVNHEAITAAKSAVIGLAKSAASSYASSNLRFNVVAPGLVNTKLTESITNNPTALKFSTAMHPLGRIGKIDDVAAAIVFLLQPENDWITAQVLAVDGGLSTLRSKVKV